MIGTLSNDVEKCNAELIDMQATYTERLDVIYRKIDRMMDEYVTKHL